MPKDTGEKSIKEKNYLNRDINSSMNSKFNSNIGSYMQRESILNQKYTRKQNKPTIRSNLLNSIKQKELDSKKISSNSLYLSDQLKNFKKLSANLKENNLKNNSTTEKSGITTFNDNKLNNFSSKIASYKNSLTNPKSPNLFGFMSKKNVTNKRNGSFDGNSGSMSFSKWTSSAKRKSDLLKSKHTKNRSMEIEPSNLPKNDKTSTRKSINNINNNQQKAPAPTIHFSVRTRKGVSANSKKINQDSFITQMNYQGKENQHLFGVYDGHGVNGHLVSNYITSNLPSFFGQHVRSGISVEEA